MANFGVGVGDFIAVGTFAWKVYRACKGASAEFEEVSREVVTLHAAIKELEDESSRQDSILARASESKRKELSELVKNIQAVLTQLEKLVTKYSILSTKHRKKWDLIRFGSEGLNEVRGKIVFHTSAVALFLTTLNSESLGRIEKKLDEIVKEFRRGDRDGSTVILVDEDEAEAEEQWTTLKDELVQDGFTRTDIETHKSWIKERLREMIEVDDTNETDEAPEDDSRDVPIAGTRDTETNETAYPWSCSICGKRYRAGWFVIAHMSRHDLYSERECPNCQTSFRNYASLRIHFGRCFRRESSDDHLTTGFGQLSRKYGQKRRASSPIGESNSRRPYIPTLHSSGSNASLENSKSPYTPTLHRSGSNASLANSIHSDVSEYDSQGMISRRTVTTTWKDSLSTPPSLSQSPAMPPKYHTLSLHPDPGESPLDIAGALPPPQYPFLFIADQPDLTGFQFLGYSWSCATLNSFDPAIIGLAREICGFCGAHIGLDIESGRRHLEIAHMKDACRHKASYFHERDEFRQHLKRDHAGIPGPWMSLLENACMQVEGIQPTRRPDRDDGPSRDQPLPKRLDLTDEICKLRFRYVSMATTLNRALRALHGVGLLKSELRTSVSSFDNPNNSLYLRRRGGPAGIFDELHEHQLDEEMESAEEEAASLCSLLQKMEIDPQ